MRIIMAVASVFVLTIASAALAQDKDPSTVAASRGQATQVFVQACIASPHMAGRSTPEPTCACAAGILSGQMTDRQYYLVGRLTPFTGNDPGMRDEILRLMGEGYTRDEILVVGNMMIAAEGLINSTCSSIDR